MISAPSVFSRRAFLAGTAAALSSGSLLASPSRPARQAQIAITLDLEMSRMYPKRDMLEWDYQKGNLDEPTKQYSIEAARIVKQRGGVLHAFCVGRVLEQPNVDWLKDMAAAGHRIGNHTYDHVNVTATKPEHTQFRFQRAPWLIRGKSAREVIHENILMTNVALKERAGIEANGFRTPGGFANGLANRPDVQQMLLDLGFSWISSQYPPHTSGQPMQEPAPDIYASIVEAQKNAQPYVYPSGLIEIPMSPISDVTAFRAHRWKLDDFLKAIRMAVEWAIETASVFDFLAHPSCLVVEDPEFQTIQMICDLVDHAGNRAALVGLDTIADSVPMKNPD
jgi:peptidoglycan/xylan/chitin deacetylase (PgdA/CDA1 family)